MDPGVLKARTEAAPYAAVWQGLSATWERRSRHETDTGELLGSWGLGWWSVSHVAMEAALLWRLTGRGDALV
jgi:hypothetical protein